MIRPRLSIATGVGLVLLAGLGLAALYLGRGRLDDDRGGEPS